MIKIFVLLSNFVNEYLEYRYRIVRLIMESPFWNVLQKAERLDEANPDTFNNGTKLCLQTREICQPIQHIVSASTTLVAYRCTPCQLNI